MCVCVCVCVCGCVRERERGGAVRLSLIIAFVYRSCQLLKLYNVEIQGGSE
jgi:hypothetical protein